MNQMVDLVEDLNMLMFGDETSKDECTSAWRRGWLVWGSRCVQQKCFVCGKRYSILPILTLNRIIAYDIIEKAMRVVLKCDSSSLDGSLGTDILRWKKMNVYGRLGVNSTGSFGVPDVAAENRHSDSV
jgi:hypothetical protein